MVKLLLSHLTWTVSLTGALQVGVQTGHNHLSGVLLTIHP